MFTPTQATVSDSKSVNLYKTSLNSTLHDLSDFFIFSFVALLIWLKNRSHVHYLLRTIEHCYISFIVTPIALFRNYTRQDTFGRQIQKNALLQISETAM